jgi:hypothetical protein
MDLVTYLLGSSCLFIAQECVLVFHSETDSPIVVIGRHGVLGTHSCTHWVVLEPACGLSLGPDGVALD